MRRVKPDPIPLAVQQKILDAAIRAPSGGNAQMWRFMLVDDAAQKARLGPIYRACLSQLWETIYKPRADAAAQAPDAPESREFVKMQRSATWLRGPLRVLSALPVRLQPVRHHRQLDLPRGVERDARGARGGHRQRAHQRDDVPHGARCSKRSDVPKDQGWNFNGCVSFGVPTGKWGVAPRTPVHEVSFRNRWGNPVGFEIPAPLWPAKR